MGTGVKPVNGDYDIDVGVVFQIGSREQPRAVKRWVYDAVKNHTNSVSWKEPCITVQYQAAREPVYHVDLAVYGRDDLGRLYLSRGKEHASNSRWERCDPMALTKAINDRFSGDEAAQFRRVVQYLKRWKDVRFPAEGNAAPVGIGLTLLAYERFKPVLRSYYSSVDDDLGALSQLVGDIRASFVRQWKFGVETYRIAAKVPVEPYDDVFDRLTDQQSLEFKGRVDALMAHLREAERFGTTAPLRSAFGAEFPE